MIGRRSVSTRTGTSSSIVTMAVAAGVIWLAAPVLIVAVLLGLCFLLVASAMFSGLVKEIGEGEAVDPPIVKYDRH